MLSNLTQDIQQLWVYQQNAMWLTSTANLMSGIVEPPSMYSLIAGSQWVVSIGCFSWDCVVQCVDASIW